MRLYKLYRLTTAHAEDAPDISKGCYDQAPTSDERNRGATAVHYGRVLFGKVCIQLLEAFLHGSF